MVYQGETDIEINTKKTNIYKNIFINYNVK